MAKEFQESEVIFQENTGNENNDHWYNFPSQGKKKNNESEAKKRGDQENSIPMKIPENLSRNSWYRYKETDLFDNGYCYGDDEEVVPPHVIIAQRGGGKIASSVCMGNGRTLKGRDLSEVRNSILRMTGFLET